MKVGITERGDAAIDYDIVLKSICKVKPDGIILITKNPSLLLDRLTKMKPPMPFIIHCTITGFGGEKIEPNVPTAEESLKAYHKLVGIYGGKQVILRVDPYLLPARSKQVIKEAEGRVRISFIDRYPHVWSRFTRQYKEYLPLLPQQSFHWPLDYRLKHIDEINKELGYEAEVCGEPGIKCTGCVSEEDLKVMGLLPPTALGKSTQRGACCCIAAKTELLSRRMPCPHDCAYCYWKREGE